MLQGRFHGDFKVLSNHVMNPRAYILYSPQRCWREY